MPGSAATSPNGKWRPSKRSHGQRPPTPSIRLHDEAGCHNDPASAVPANRPMMSTISNTFADYNIDLEEEEENEESAATNSSADDDEEAYVIQVKPLPKIRLDLCPAPREEDEYRDPNRHRKKKSRRRSSSGRSSTNESSPDKSKKEKGGSISDTETTPVLNSSLTTTATTDKADNDGGGLDAKTATTEILPSRQNGQHTPRSPADETEHAENDVAVENTMVDADGFPVMADVREERNNNESSTKKAASQKLAPMFASSPSPALAIHQGTVSHSSRIIDSAGDTGSRSLPNSNAAVAPSVDYKNAKEEEQPNAQPRPDSTADTASITPKTHHRKNRKPHKPKARQITPPRRMEDKQVGCSPRRSEYKANKKADEEQRKIEDEEDVSSPIFDWLLMICGDVSSFVTEGCMGSPEQNGIDHQLNAKTGKQNEERVQMGGGRYDLDRFKW